MTVTNGPLTLGILANRLNSSERRLITSGNIEDVKIKLLNEAATGDTEAVGTKVKVDYTIVRDRFVSGDGDGTAKYIPIGFNSLAIHSCKKTKRAFS